MTEQLTRAQRVAALRAALTQRILILDGAMGTMIQGYQLVESNFRGARFVTTSQLLAGNNDLLTLTAPEIITEIHASYLAAGADIVETNTFNSTRASQADYGLEELAYELNEEAAKLAPRCVRCSDPDHAKQAPLCRWHYWSNQQDRFALA